MNDAFAAGCLCLEQHRDAVNALNVFPVPDGDTGTNMLLTLRAAMEKVTGESDPEESTGIEDLTVSEFASRFADGAFWGARGNSGVILSQFIAGFSGALSEVESCTASDLARAFASGRESAYQSVGNPVEGTMLTVLGAMHPAAEALLEEGEENPLALWEAAFEAALAALESTPMLLPVLKEVGVVDAGGLGAAVIVGGALDHMAGTARLDAAVEAFEAAAPEPQALAGLQSGSGDEEHVAWGFCIQFVIQGQGLEPEAIRQRFAGMETLSTVVAGNDRQVRLHLHAEDPEPFLAYGRSLGQLHQISIQDMDEQNVEMVAEAGARSGRQTELALVAIASGDGLERLFRNAGCAGVVAGGQTMNPSVAQMLESAESTGANSVIVLPNNGNIVAAARQAATRDSRLNVVPSRSIPQGIAAALAFNPASALQDNLENMERAISEIISIEVTTAVRDTTIGGTAVGLGQCIALTDGELAAVDDSPEAALHSALGKAGAGDGSLVTLYLGQQASMEDAEELSGRLQDETPGVEVELVYGGQPHYHYLVSVE